MSAQDSDTQLNNRQQEESLLKKWFRKKEVLLRRLFRERFLGVVYLDCKTQKLGVYYEQLTGKFSEYINPDGGFYNEEAARVIREKLCRDQPEAALRKLTFESLKSELENRSAYEADFYIPGADGNHVYIRVSFEYEDKSKERIMIFAEDVTKLISGEIDPLTGRYNSTGFYKRIEEWIADHPGRRYRLHLYDLDYFKDINGVYGYKLSDRLLRDIGEYMRKYDTPDSFSAHLNDDRFARFCADDGISVPDCYNNFVQCLPISAATSHTAEPRPLMMLWSSTVMTLLLRTRHARSRNGTPATFKGRRNGNRQRRIRSVVSAAGRLRAPQIFRRRSAGTLAAPRARLPFARGIYSAGRTYRLNYSPNPQPDGAGQRADETTL